MMKRALSLLLALCLVLSLSITANAASSQKIVTDPTGYTEASDVEYVKVGSYIANWGARGEDCVFLSTYAQQFYSGLNTYEYFLEMDGGTGTSTAPSSELYSALKTLMTSRHTHQTSYGETRDLYRYTDCLRSDYDHISSFYSGTTLNGAWDSGNTWNREHTWPNSKGDASGNGENDIMMLRPTATSENGSRGNKAYGESSSYYDPNSESNGKYDLRGDVSRIMLYVYVRWGNTGSMWGSSGVMESLEVLLKWMEEDPVDTWEMGRNDAVQSITGTRNVFVDYPELAWLLFGEEIPEGMTTPSGNAASACPHAHTVLRNAAEATCTTTGYTGDTYCTDCSKTVSTGTTIPALAHGQTQLQNAKPATCTADGFTGNTVCVYCGGTLAYGTIIDKTGHTDNNNDLQCDTCGADVNCIHSQTQLEGQEDATCTTAGNTGNTVCAYCHVLLAYGDTIPAKGHSDQNGDQTCDSCGISLTCSHSQTELRSKVDATCGENGYSGDLYCVICADLVAAGKSIPATGRHTFAQWEETPEGRSRACDECDYVETEVNTPTEPMGTEPVPTAPSTEPAPTESAPTEPAPTEPIPTNPAPTEPAGTEDSIGGENSDGAESTPATEDPTEPSTGPAPTEPVPTEPAKTDPPAQDPTSGSAPSDPADPEPEPGFPVGWVILGGLILAGGVAVFVFLKKKKAA